MRRHLALILLAISCSHGPQAAVGELELSAPAAAAGQPVQLTAMGGPTGFSGTVHFESSDAQADLPADLAFELNSNEIKTFQLELKTSGDQTVTAKDAIGGRVVGLTTVHVTGGAPSTFKFTVEPAGTACAPFGLGVTASDAFGNVAPSYVGTLQVESGLAPDYALTADDAGHHVFSLGLEAADKKTLTVTGTGGLSGTADLTSRTWCQTGPVIAQVQAIAVDPGPPAKIYAATPGGVFRSLDQGVTWENFSAGISSHELFTFGMLTGPGSSPTIWLAMTGGLYRLRPGDTHWWPSGDGLNQGGQAVSVAADRGHPATVFLGTGRGVNSLGLLRSTDGGDTFTRVTDGVPGPGIAVLAVAVDPASSSVFAAYDGGLLYRSDDGVNGWTPITAPADSINGLIVSDTGALFAATGSGLYRSRDRGASWQLVLQGSFLNATLGGPTSLYVPNWFSTDDGDTWTPFSGPSAGVIQQVAPGPGGMLYGATGTVGVVRSTDGGASWHEAASGMTAGVIWTLAIDRASDTLYATSGDLIFTSTDHGGTWHRRAISSGGSIESLLIDPATPSTLYAVAGSVWKSVDSGASWQPAQTGLAGASVRDISLDLHDPNTLWAGAQDGIYKSTDGAATWRASGLAGSWVASIAFDPADPKVVYARTGGAFYRSGDRGASWAAAQGIPTEIDPHPVVVSPKDGTVYAGANDGVYRSTDGGRTFTHITPRNIVLYYALSLALDPDDPDVIYLGTPYDVRWTKDGGKSWTLLVDGFIPSPQLRALVVSGSRVYAGSTGGSVYRRWTLH